MTATVVPSLVAAAVAHAGVTSTVVRSPGAAVITGVAGHEREDERLGQSEPPSRPTTSLIVWLSSINYLGPMTEVGVHDAKTRLSELLREVEAGGQVVVTRGGRAVARLVPVAPDEPARVERFGVLAAEVGDPGDWTDDDAEMAELFGLPTE